MEDQLLCPTGEKEEENKTTVVISNWLVIPPTHPPKVALLRLQSSPANGSPSSPQVPSTPPFFSDPNFYRQLTHHHK